MKKINIQNIIITTNISISIITIYTLHIHYVYTLLPVYQIYLLFYGTVMAVEIACFKCSRTSGWLRIGMILMWINAVDSCSSNACSPRGRPTGCCQLHVHVHSSSSTAACDHQVMQACTGWHGAGLEGPPPVEHPLQPRAAVEGCNAGCLPEGRYNTGSRVVANWPPGRGAASHPLLPPSCSPWWLSWQFLNLVVT